MMEMMESLQTSTMTARASSQAIIWTLGTAITTSPVMPACNQFASSAAMVDVRLTSRGSVHVSEKCITNHKAVYNAELDFCDFEGSKDEKKYCGRHHNVLSSVEILVLQGVREQPPWQWGKGKGVD